MVLVRNQYWTVIWKNRHTTCHFPPFPRILSVIFLIDKLRTKRRPLYLKTQFVPRSKHFSSRSYNQSFYDVSGTSRCLFSDKYKTHKYSVGRTYNCWMLNCWCITWPVVFKRLNCRMPRRIIGHLLAKKYENWIFIRQNPFPIIIKNMINILSLKNCINNLSWLSEIMYQDPSYAWRLL